MPGFKRNKIPNIFFNLNITGWEVGVCRPYTDMACHGLNHLTALSILFILFVSLNKINKISYSVFTGTQSQYR